MIVYDSGPPDTSRGPRVPAAGRLVEFWRTYIRPDRAEVAEQTMHCSGYQELRKLAERTQGYQPGQAVALCAFLDGYCWVHGRRCDQTQTRELLHRHGTAYIENVTPADVGEVIPGVPATISGKGRPSPKGGRARNVTRRKGRS